MLRPGADDGRGARRPRPVRRLGRPDADRLRRLPGLLARARRSTTTASRSAPPTTARSTASRPSRRSTMQELLGADIQMVLDVCPPLPSPDPSRSAWRSSAPRRGPSGPGPPTDRGDQALFGIVQGGIDDGAAGRERASARSSSTSTATASAGCRWARRATRCCPALAAALAHLPGRPPALPDGRRRPGVPGRGRRPRRRPVRLRDADPARPPRHRPHRRGRLQVRNARHARSDEPIDPDCACRVCARHSRGYLRHLFQVGEPTAARLLSWHNLAWTLALMDRCRDAIAAGTLASLRREVLGHLGVTQGSEPPDASLTGCTCSPA